MGYYKSPLLHGNSLNGNFKVDHGFLNFMCHVDHIQWLLMINI